MTADGKIDARGMLARTRARVGSGSGFGDDPPDGGSGIPGVINPMSLLGGSDTIMGIPGTFNPITGAANAASAAGVAPSFSWSDAVLIGIVVFAIGGGLIVLSKIATATLGASAPAVASKKLALLAGLGV